MQATQSADIAQVKQCHKLPGELKCPYAIDFRHLEIKLPPGRITLRLLELGSPKRAPCRSSPFFMPPEFALRALGEAFICGSGGCEMNGRFSDLNRVHDSSASARWRMGLAAHWQVMSKLPLFITCSCTVGCDTVIDIQQLQGQKSDMLRK